MTEVLEVRAEIRTRAGAEVSPRRLEQRVLERNDRRRIRRRSARTSRPAQSAARNSPSSISQSGLISSSLPANEDRRLVRRVAIPRRAQRQRLPPALPGLVEPVHPCHGGRTDIADAVRRGQRRDVQQHARRAIPGGNGGTLMGGARDRWRRRASWASLTIASRCACAPEALRVDLVDVLGAGRPRREPAASASRPSGRRSGRRCRGRASAWR